MRADKPKRPFEPFSQNVMHNDYPFYLGWLGVDTHGDAENKDVFRRLLSLGASYGGRDAATSSAASAGAGVRRGVPQTPVCAI